MTTHAKQPTAVTPDPNISAYGEARSTVKETPLSPDELGKINAYWRASLYLCLGMLYLKENPLLREPLKLEHTKSRLLGHWGSDAGQAFTYIHFNRLINNDAPVILMETVYISAGLVGLNFLLIPFKYRKLKMEDWKIEFLDFKEFEYFPTTVP